MRQTRSRWILAWTGAAGIGVANGAGREALYADRVVLVPAAMAGGPELAQPLALAEHHSRAEAA